MIIKKRRRKTGSKTYNAILSTISKHKGKITEREKSTLCSLIQSHGKTIDELWQSHFPSK